MGIKNLKPNLNVNHNNQANIAYRANSHSITSKNLLTKDQISKMTDGYVTPFDLQAAKQALEAAKKSGSHQAVVDVESLISSIKVGLGMQGVVTTGREVLREMGVVNGYSSQSQPGPKEDFGLRFEW
jgi:hypothetical protein